jgi:hypothetical protein
VRIDLRHELLAESECEGPQPVRTGVGRFRKEVIAHTGAVQGTAIEAQIVEGEILGEGGVAQGEEQDAEGKKRGCSCVGACLAVGLNAFRSITLPPHIPEALYIARKPLWRFKRWKSRVCVSFKTSPQTSADGVARQGHATSPAAANIAFQSVDKRILKGLRKICPDAVYTRYARGGSSVF